MDEELFKMIGDGEILGFKRTSTFGLFGSYAHTSASYDVFVDVNLPLDEPSVRGTVAALLNTDPHYIRIVVEQMTSGDYPEPNP